MTWTVHFPNTDEAVEVSPITADWLMAMGRLVPREGHPRVHRAGVGDSEQSPEEVRLAEESCRRAYAVDRHSGQNTR